MELIYLWIEDYFVLKNCAFNFSNQYLISQSSSENGVNITIEDNPQHIESFFPANIKSVIAIVGENGVGKSSLLDFILRANHYPDTIGCGWIAVYKNEPNHLAIIHDSGTDTKATISISLRTLAKLKVDIKTPQEREERYDKSRLKLLSIFYNPSLDLKEYGRSLHDIENGVSDVSTNHLIISDNEDNTEKSYDQVENHRFKNVYRQFALAQSERLDKNELRIPESIEVRFNKNTQVNTSDLDSSASQLYKLLDELGRQAVHDANGTIARSGKEQRSRQIAKLQKVKLWFLRNLVSNYFSNLAKVYDFQDRRYVISADQFPDSFIEAVRELFSRQTFVSKSKFNINNFIDVVFSTIDNNALLTLPIVDNDAFFNVRVDKALPIHEMHLKYTLQFQDREESSGFLDFNWRDLSNGEKAFMDLYSRLFHGYTDLQYHLQAIPILYILIDEGELGFHPEWQKGYVNNLIKFLTRLTNLEIQLILTSHSPFVLSDLPKSNVVLLEKDESGIAKVASLEVKTETFGANIHELFTDSFFISNGTIGDFAKHKIEEIIANLTSKAVSTIPKNEIKKTIEIIGETVIRERLLDMYHETFGSESDEERIERLRKELAEAEAKQKRHDKG